MGDQAGATLQNYNSELVSVRCSGCVAALCAQRAHQCAALCLAVHRGAERQERRAQRLDRHRRRGERCGYL